MDATESITHFYQTALDMLSTPASEQVPETTLYHPSAAPTLLVHVGSAQRLPEIRRQLPDNTFLLGLHGAAETITESYCLGRTLTTSIEGGDDCVNRVAQLVALLPEKRVQLITEEGFRKRFAAECETVENTIQVALANDTNEKRRGLIRLRSACANLRRIQEGAPVLPHAIDASVPVVFCGAGPSLAKHLEQLKPLKGRAVIAAVGHAVQSLNSAGIVPDIIFESDPVAIINWPDGLAPDAVLVASTEVSSDVAKRFRSICWVAGSCMPVNTIVEAHGRTLGKVTLGKTVSVQSLDFLQRMGFRNIALLGQDYCLGDDGQLYAESSEKSESDKYFEVASAQGRTKVLTNQSLRDLQKSMNTYLNLIAKTDGLKLVNVSGGAELEHAVVMELSDWISSLDSSGIPSLFSVRAAESSNEMFSVTESEIKTDMQAIELIIKSCRSMITELDRHPLRMDKVKSRQSALESAISEEVAVREKSLCAVLLHTLFQHADEIMKQTPGMVSTDTDPTVQLNYLSCRYGLIKRLCEDMLASMNEGGDPHWFTAFQMENRRVLKKINPELAERVMNFNAQEHPDFKLRCFNQLVPYVERKVAGEWIELSAFASIYKEASEVVGKFIKDTGFDPCRDALTILAPGNWAYVLEFLRRYPMLELAVIDPWPELLSQMMPRGCFLHLLPERAVVVDTWASPLYMKRRGKWNKLGMRKHTFIAPHVSHMPDVEVLVRNLGVLP